MRKQCSLNNKNDSRREGTHMQRQKHLENIRDAACGTQDCRYCKNSIERGVSLD